jgi:hypothetical protein
VERRVRGWVAGAGGLTVLDAVELACFADNEVQIFVHALQIPIQHSSVLQHDADGFAEQLDEGCLGSHGWSGLGPRLVRDMR